MANGLKIAGLVSAASGAYDWMKENTYYFFGPILMVRLVATTAGVAVARTMFIETYENCVPEHPTAIMSILGTDDFNSLYNGVEFAGVLSP